LAWKRGSSGSPASVKTTVCEGIWTAVRREGSPLRMSLEFIANEKKGEARRMVATGSFADGQVNSEPFS